MTAAVSDLTPWHRDNICPDECLCHNPSRAAVRDQLEPFLLESDPTYNHAVYVLECRRRSREAATYLALDELDICSIPGWVRAAPQFDRLFYIGVSQRPAVRIYQHAIASGANFTELFPPVRIVDIDWYTNVAESYREEVRKADRYRAAYPDAYVSQPG